MKRIPLCAAALALPALAAASAAQAYVSPLVVETSPATITIANTGTQPLRLKLEQADFDQDAAGRTIFGAVGSSAHTCSGRLRVGQVPTQIPARGEVQLAVAVDAGAQACWGAVVIQFSTGFAAAGRIGVKVYAVHPGAERSADVTSIRLTAGTLQAEIFNTGSTPLRPHGRIEVRTPQGAVVSTMAVEAFGLHPGVRRWATVPLEKHLAPGRYVVLALFDIGARDLIAGEARIDVPGPGGSPR
jgi:hypothetical protein